jgi:hypothetical protein
MSEDQWIVTTLRRLALMWLALVEQRYPNLKARRCPHCDQVLDK